MWNKNNKSGENPWKGICAVGKHGIFPFSTEENTILAAEMSKLGTENEKNCGST